MSMRCVYWVGPCPGVAEQLAADLGAAAILDYPTAARADDLVFLAVRPDAASADKLPAGNAFVACRKLKDDPRIRVFLLIDAGDGLSPEIARFCLADGCVPVDVGGVDLSVVRDVLLARHGRTPVDEALAQLERELLSDRGRQASALQRAIDADCHGWVLEHLTDRATGLFSGPFAAFKLEEEWKRASRFHQALSLLLVELGPQDCLPRGHAERDACLAEAASVLLTESRDIDLLARFTDSMLVMLLPGTGAAGAATVARRVLQQLGARPFPGAPGLRAVAGLVTAPAPGIEHRRAFLARAEARVRLAWSGQGSAGLCQ